MASPTFRVLTQVGASTAFRRLFLHSTKLSSSGWCDSQSHVIGLLLPPSLGTGWMLLSLLPWPLCSCAPHDSSEVANGTLIHQLAESFCLLGCSVPLRWWILSGGHEHVKQNSSQFVSTPIYPSTCLSHTLLCPSVPVLYPSRPLTR